MIGVIANPSEHSVVCEFFELFKTPWEFYRSEGQYEVLLCSGDARLPENLAKLVLIYAGQKLPFDAESEIEIASEQKETRILSYGGIRIPIYGCSITFRERGTVDSGDEGTHQQAMHLEQQKGRVLARIGYDLFGEVRALLTLGQPAANAGIPALELHIAVLRDLIVASGFPLVEIPPVPAGYRFIACLTHDVDHPSIRHHKFDHTMFGFLGRAVLGSVFDVLRGRARLRNLLTNWAAALKLPFVHLGLAKDFWHEFDDYTKLEKGLSSSFFVIPFKDNPGRTRRESRRKMSLIPFPASCNHRTRARSPLRDPDEQTVASRPQPNWSVNCASAPVPGARQTQNRGPHGLETQTWCGQTCGGGWRDDLRRGLSKQ